MRRGGLIGAGIVAVAAASAGLALGGSPDPNAVGPSSRIQPDGRHLLPVGRLTSLGNHPGGGALTPNGRFLWALDVGRGRNDIKVVDAVPVLGCHQRGRRLRACRKRAKRRAGKVIQTIPMPGVDGGIAMGPDGKTAYVSGLPDSPHKDQPEVVIAAVRAFLATH